MERRRRVLLIVVVALLIISAPWLYNFYRTRQIVAHNLAARGGQAAWDGIQAVRFTGSMELGSDQKVNFRLEQGRPEQSCFSYTFNKQDVFQCTNGKDGWKQAPYTGKTGILAMDAAEVREASAGADPRGLLIDAGERGISVRFLREELYEGRPAAVLQVNLPLGAVRTVYLDQETGLELKVVSTRHLVNKDVPVETLYSDWASTGGVLFPQRLSSKTEGDDTSYTLEIKTMQVNPVLAPDRFKPPPGIGGR